MCSRTDFNLLSGFLGALHRKGEPQAFFGLWPCLALSPEPDRHPTRYISMGVIFLQLGEDIQGMDEILHHLRNPDMKNANKQWFLMVSKWCRISSIHSNICCLNHLPGPSSFLKGHLCPWLTCFWRGVPLWDSLSLPPPSLFGLYESGVNKLRTLSISWAEKGLKLWELFQEISRKFRRFLCGSSFWDLVALVWAVFLLLFFYCRNTGRNLEHRGCPTLPLHEPRIVFRNLSKVMTPVKEAILLARKLQDKAGGGNPVFFGGGAWDGY